MLNTRICTNEPSCQKYSKRFFSAERTQSHFATYVAREGNASVLIFSFPCGRFIFDYNMPSSFFSASP